MARTKKYEDAVQLRLPAELKDIATSKAKASERSLNEYIVEAVQNEVVGSRPVPVEIAPLLDRPVLERIMDAQAVYLSERGQSPVNLILGANAWCELKAAVGSEPPPGMVPECLGMDVVLGLPVELNHVNVFGAVASELKPVPESAWLQQLRFIKSLPRATSGAVFAALLGERIKVLPIDFPKMSLEDKAAWLEINSPLEFA